MQSVLRAKSETKESRSLNYLVQTDTGILLFVNKEEGCSRTPTEEVEVSIRNAHMVHKQQGTWEIMV